MHSMAPLKSSFLQQWETHARAFGAGRVHQCLFGVKVHSVWLHVNNQSQRRTPNFTFPLSKDCVVKHQAVHHYISAQRNVKLIWSRCSPSEKMVLSVRNADLASVCRETNLGTNAEHLESCFYQMFETLDSWLQQKLTSTPQSSVRLPIMVCETFFKQLNTV